MAKHHVESSDFVKYSLQLEYQQQLSFSLQLELQEFHLMIFLVLLE